MNRRQEKVLVAALCGLVITAAAAFAVQPALAGGSGAAHSDRLDMRKWSTSHSLKIDAFAPYGVVVDDHI